jgi:gluconolactonase
VSDRPPDGGTVRSDSGSFSDASVADADSGVNPDASAAEAGQPVNPLEDAGTVALIQDGFQFLEGPVWVAEDQVLLFSDIPASKIYRLQLPNEIDVFREDSEKSNGLALAADGALLAAEHGAQQVSRTPRGGTKTTLVDSYELQKLNSPNDLVIRSDGVLYFTDPPFGLEGRPRELDFNGIFRWTGTSLVLEEAGDLDARPNGVVLSPDESKLYVSDSEDGRVRVFDVATSGALTNPRPFAQTSGVADGMAVDSAGNVYVTTVEGVEVYAPDGSKWGTLSVPEQPSNCTFGGLDGRTLFITAREGLYRIQLPIAGLGF